MGIDFAALFIQIAIGVVVGVVGYALMPKPKATKPAEVSDLESPTAEAGRPIPVIFGTLTIKGPNILWFGEKGVEQFEIDV